MKDKSLVSIIIPAYNAQDTIQRCIKSCLKQTYSNIEVIVVDDGSTDDTFSILKEMAKNDERVRPIYSENKGVSSARNIGLDNADGEFISFVDSDDTLELNAVQDLMKISLKNESDISIGQHRTVSSNKIEEQHYKNNFCIWKDDEALIESLKDNTATYSVWGRLYTRDIIGETRFIIGKKIHEDSFFFFQLLLKRPTVAVTDQIIYNYYAEKNSAGRTAYSEKFLDILYFAQQKKELIEELYPQLTDMSYNVLIKADLSYLSLCYCKCAKGVKETEKKCISEIKKYKQYYIPMTKYNNKLFSIVTHNLYYLLKFIQRFRR